jgi:ribosomal-protein-alanine N-acetyltransferase
MIETDRCRLTALRADDLEHVVALYTDEDVRRFLGGPRDEAEVRSKFPMLLQSNAKTRYWAVRLKADDTFIGIIDLGPHHDGTDIEVSYQFLPVWWGQGYATETVQAVVNYTLEDLGLPRVIAETQMANVASRRLLARLDMRLTQTVERFGARQAIYATDTTERQ